MKKVHHAASLLPRTFHFFTVGWFAYYTPPQLYWTELTITLSDIK